MINFAAITPHPPIIIPGIGKPEDLGRAKKTISAMEKLAQELANARPDVIVVISSHAPIHPYSFGVNKEHHLVGSFMGFGLDQKLEFKNELEMASRIIYVCKINNEIPVHTYKSELDHGVTVPLYYLTQNWKPMILPVSFSSLDLHMHYDFGELLGKICREEKKEVAIIASGDLSHRLSPESPAGFSPRGAEFDQKLIKALEAGSLPEILELKEGLINEAGECGLRSIIMLLGALKGTKFKFKKYGYESPFGVGYLSARLV